MLLPRQIDVPRAAAGLRPEQHLAAAVIRQAVLDLQQPGSVRFTALDFFAGNSRLRFWCAIAGLDPALVQRKAGAAGRS